MADAIGFEPVVNLAIGILDGGMVNFDIDAHTILKVVHGSHAYGTNIEGSDVDIRGVAIPPREYFLGFVNRFEQAESNVPDDSVIYDIRKFCALAADCNPNIIEVLHVDERHVTKATDAGRRLREAGSLFLSTKARWTFAGYAHGQLKRIRGHRAWLLSPPTEPPKREDYGLRSDRKELNASVMGAMDELLDQGHELSGAVMQTLDAEKRYAQALQHWKQYQTWKRQRNPARAKLERIAGYDTKHAMHLVRLLRMCEEILRGEGVKVFREDAEELLDIRRGEWEYDRLIEWAEQQEQRCADLYETSPLPKKPDTDALDRLCIELVEDTGWRTL